MGKLILTENGQTIVRNFTHIVPVSRNGRLGRPEPFNGTLFLVTGLTRRTLEVHPGVQVDWYSIIERLIYLGALFVISSGLLRLVEMLNR